MVSGFWHDAQAMAIKNEIKFYDIVHTLEFKFLNQSIYIEKCVNKSELFFLFIRIYE